MVEFLFVLSNLRVMLNVFLQRHYANPIMPDSQVLLIEGVVGHCDEDVIRPFHRRNPEW